METVEAPAKQPASGAGQETTTAEQNPSAPPARTGGGSTPSAEGRKSSFGAMVTYAGILARALSFVARAATTSLAVYRLKKRYDDRGDSARYLSEAMTVLDVDEPTTTQYMEVYRLSEAMSGNVSAIVSASDELSVVGQELEKTTRDEHGRMADANRTHSVPMAQPSFIKQK